MKLYGSYTSPYVRRLRILLAQTDYELVTVDVFGKDRAMLTKLSPTVKIPMLVDEHQGEPLVLNDSGLIYRYLVENKGFTGLSYAQQNLLTVIDACNESLVNMMIMRRSDIDGSQDKLFFTIQRDRQQASFDLLEQEVGQGKFAQWNYLSISLLVLMEWVQFRQLYDFSNYPNLLQFLSDNQHHIGVKNTAPKD